MGARERNKRYVEEHPVAIRFSGPVGPFLDELAERVGLSRRKLAEEAIWQGAAPAAALAAERQRREAEQFLNDRPAEPAEEEA